MKKVNSIIPGLSLDATNDLLWQEKNYVRTNQEKQMEVIEYLRSLSRDQTATYVDIERELDINLHTDIELLEMLKSNPLIDRNLSPDGVWSFQFRAKFHIGNKTELLQNISRIKCGIILEDIKKCYPALEYDVSSLIVGGDIIAAKNKEKQTLVLYPRGDRFYSRLSGTVTATPGEQIIATSANLCEEIRRGEAIQVGDCWYRVDSTIGSGAAGEQTQRSTAPPSVTLEKDLSDRNKYYNPFTPKQLPLDGDFDGDQEFVGVALKHGCTNDVKECWKKTAENLKKFIGNEEALPEELLALNLISRPLSAASLEAKRRQQLRDRNGANGKKVKKERVKRKPRDISMAGYGANAHLRGTRLEQILKGK